MKALNALAFMGVLLCAAGTAGADQGPYPATEEAVRAEIDKLVWQQEPVTYQLAASHSNFTLPQGYLLVTGDDARRLMFLINGTEYPDTEAVAVDPNSSQLVWFSYFDSGYVADDDWSDLDADALIEQIKAGTEEANEERRKNGVAALHIKGWAEKPRFDAEARIAYWAVDAEDEETGPLRNMKAIRLSRHGYHEVVWAGAEEDYGNAAAVLDTMLKAHAYDPGFRYADHSDGDMVAGFGIASLVAVAAGGEKTKGVIAAIIAAAVIFLKKGWIVILAVLGGGWAMVKRLLGRRKAVATVSAARSDAPDGGGTA